MITIHGYGLFRLADHDLWLQLHAAFRDKVGVYRLHCVSEQGGAFVPIPRVLEFDHAGILYIGEGTSLVTRVTLLKASFEKKTLDNLKHGAAFIYRMHPGLQKRYPYEQLWISAVATTERPEEHRDRERTELRTYFVDFGELPPLNRNETKLNLQAEIDRLFQAKAGNVITPRMYTCLVFLDDGTLCGKPATLVDLQQGVVVCAEHAP